jgi:hypothetical protein
MYSSWELLIMHRLKESRSQVQARSHPNMLKTQTFLNQLYHAKPGTAMEGVDLATPLTYADRFRIRHPGGAWGFHPPHIDGQSFLFPYISTLSRG